MKKSGKKILVTGATGYVGKHLVDSLVENGYWVYALSRKRSLLFSNYQTVELIIGDITELDELPSNIDIIYHCAGTVHNIQEMDRVNVRGTQRIVELALKLDCRLIYLSSAGIVGMTSDTVIDEHTVCHPHNAYELSKYRAEEIVVRAIKNGLRAHIVRPTTIFGGEKGTPRKDSFFQLVQSMRTGTYKNIGNGRYNIIHIDEMVKALILLDETPVAYGGTYIISNSIQYRDMDILVKNLDPIVKKRTGTIPLPIANIASVILSVVCWILRRKNPLTFSRLRALTNERVYVQSTVLQTLGLIPTMPIEDYIKKTCAAYIDQHFLP